MQGLREPLHTPETQEPTVTQSTLEEWMTVTPSSLSQLARNLNTALGYKNEVIKSLYTDKAS